MTDWDDLMDFAARVAAEAGEITLRAFGSALVRHKQDGSEVTEADLAAEAFIRAAVRERFPDDGIVGEEGDDVPSQTGRRWIADPIDGTRSFAAGVPLYTVLLTLEVDGDPALGVIHAPATRQTLVAARGAGAWLDGRPARVSECDDLAAARVVTSGLEYWRDFAGGGRRAAFERLVKATRFARTWGDGYGYLMVATGRAEIMADPIAGHYWDYAPMHVLLTEAGGRVAQFDGSPLARNSTSLATNGRLHDAAADLLNAAG
jgi:histidinol-phosphatase